MVQFHLNTSIIFQARETTVLCDSNNPTVVMMVGLIIQHAGNMNSTANIRNVIMAASSEQFLHSGLNIHDKPRVRCYLCPHWLLPAKIFESHIVSHRLCRIFCYLFIYFNLNRLDLLWICADN